MFKFDNWLINSNINVNYTTLVLFYKKYFTLCFDKIDNYCEGEILLTFFTNFNHYLKKKTKTKYIIIVFTQFYVEKLILYNK